MPRPMMPARRRREESEPLGDRQVAGRSMRRLGDGRSSPQCARRDRAHELDAGRGVLEVRELGPRLRRGSRARAPDRRARTGWSVPCSAMAMAIASRSPSGALRDGSLGVAHDECRHRGPAGGDDDARCVEPRPLGGIGGDLERLLEERDRLLVRAERGRPLGRAPERDARLGGERIRLGRVRGQPLRREVVPGEPARELVGAQVLEVARGGEVADLAVPLRERVVGDLADERLDEGVLAALRASGDRRRGRAARAGRARAAAAPAPTRRRRRPPRAPGMLKLWPRTAASATQRRGRPGPAPSRRAAMSAVSVSGTASVVEVPTGRYDPPSTHEPALREQHPHRLDGVQRHAVGARHDGRHGLRRQPGHEAGEQALASRRGGSGSR